MGDWGHQPVLYLCCLLLPFLVYFQGHPPISVGGGGGSTPNASANQSVIQVAKTCSGQVNCFPVHDDGQVLWGVCSWSSGSPTVTCPSGTFAATDVGKIAFGTNLLQTGYTSYQTAVTQISGTISTFTDSAHVNLSANATGNSVSNSPFFFGTDDTSNLSAAWTAAENVCGRIKLSNGYMPWLSAVFINAPSTCTAPSGATGGAAARGLGIDGTGNSYIVFPPAFNYTTCTGPDGTGTACIGWGPNGALNQAGGETLSGWGIEGFGQSNLAAAVSLVYVPSDAFIEKFSCAGIGAADASMVGLQLNTFNAVITDTSFDGCASGVIETGTSTQVQISRGFYGDVSGTDLYFNGTGAQVTTTQVLWGAVSGSAKSAIFADHAGTWSSVQDVMQLPISSSDFGIQITANLAANLVGFLTTQSSNFSSGVIFRTTNGTVHLSQSNLTTTGTSSKAITMAGGSVFDDGGNTFSSPSANTIGNFFGSLSNTGVGQTAAHITPSTAWGTSGAAGNGVSGVIGDAMLEQFTITAAGTPSASPTVAVVFASAFQTAPVCYNAQQTGGTGAINTISIGTPTATGVTLTWNGTPVAAKTYIIALSCSN